MAQWWWQGEGWENAYFKRVPEGWVFRAPNPWILGHRRHYLVSETQRADLMAYLDDASWRRIIAAAFFAVFVLSVMALTLWLVPTLWNAGVLNFILVSIVLGYLINIYFWLALRPLLAGASRTTERIRFGERLRAYAAVIPLGQLILFVLLFACLFTFYAYEAFTSAGSPLIDSLIASAVCGSAAIYLLAMLIAKRKMTAGPWS